MILCTVSAKVYSMTTATKENAASRYKDVQINTSTKVKAICMLHDRCVQFLVYALDIPAQKREFCIKSQNILSQLEMALTMDDQISKSLFLLYDYCYVLIEKGSETDVNNAGEILVGLRDTFRYLGRRPR
jgi:flagellin-specific chaperone FliS